MIYLNQVALLLAHNKRAILFIVVVVTINTEKENN